MSNEVLKTELARYYNSDNRLKVITISNYYEMEKSEDKESYFNFHL